MSILSIDDYLASKRALYVFRKTASRTAVAANLFSNFDLAGFPGAGTLAGTSTAAGVVPTDATAGFPSIADFDAGAKGYLSRVTFSSSVTGILHLVDVVFKAGAYAYNANVTLSGQPSFASRMPGGNDFRGNEIWLEAVTAFTGNQSIRITYLDQDGNAGDTGVIATGVAPIVGRCFKMPLAAGDSGVQRIDSVISSVSTAGTFNVLVVRRLLSMRIPLANFSDTWDLLKTGMPEVFQDSAIAVYVQPDSTATGLPDVLFEVAAK